MTYGEQRCNYHLQVYLFYRQRKKKTSSILLKSSVRCRKPGPGVRHALWTEVVKKILKIGRSLLKKSQMGGRKEDDRTSLKGEPLP